MQTSRFACSHCDSKGYAPSGSPCPHCAAFAHNGSRHVGVHAIGKLTAPSRDLSVVSLIRAALVCVLGAAFVLIGYAGDESFLTYLGIGLLALGVLMALAEKFVELLVLFVNSAIGRVGIAICLAAMGIILILL